MSSTKRLLNRIKGEFAIEHTNKKNCLRWGSNESINHIMMKLVLCLQLKRQKHDFVSECVFKNGCRCDVFDLDSLMIWEVVESEKEKSLVEKRGKYPFRFFVVKADMWKEELL